MAGKQDLFPTYFLSHGGGPWPFLKDGANGAYDALEASLRAIPATLPAQPRAVLMVSGHWEEETPAVMSAAHPGMVYDYTGFPEHTYRVSYPAPGSPALAGRVAELLAAARIPVRADPTRGFDHGAWTVLYPMWPAADVPVVQLSILSGHDPADHFALGRALRPLRAEGVLIVGSGLSYHNLRRMGRAARSVSKHFDDWLQAALAMSDRSARTARLERWAEAPLAREAHPEADHLVPLFVALGAAEEAPALCVYHEEAFFGGVTASSFRFG